MTKKIFAYELIKEYRGCSKRLGYIELYTTGEFSKLPEYWKPVYFKPEPQMPTDETKKTGQFLTKIGALVVSEGSSKDTVMIGLADYSLAFFVNTRHLLRRPNFDIYLHGMKLTSGMMDKVIEIIEERKYVVC